MTSTIGRLTPEYLENANWFKSSASSANGGCLEVAFLPDGNIALRDNEDLSKPPFVVTAHVWRCFLDGAQRGEFDLPAS